MLPPAHYTDLLQAQLRTSSRKPFVWYATDSRTDQQVVIKGPVSAAEAAAVEHTEALKARLGLPNTFLRTESHDSGGGSSALFLVWRSLLDYRTLATRVAAQGRGRNRHPVVVPTNTANKPWRWHNRMLGDPALTRSLMEALLFRKLVGTDDTCQRNLMIVGSTVYSIDDAARQTPSPLMWKMPMRAALFGAALDRVWPRVAETVSQWRPLVAHDAYAAKALETYADKAAWRWS